MRAKKKEIEGIEYLVLGSAVEREGIRIVYQSWTTTKGKVVYQNGKYTHPPQSEQGANNDPNK